MKWLSRRIAAPGPYLLLCVTEDQYIKAMKHCNVKTANAWINPNSHATTHILESSDMGLMCVVCMPVIKRHKVEIIGLLVHEAVHVWQAYAKSIGEDKPGDEQMAYGIQSTSQELIDSYYKLSKKIK